MKTSQSPSHQLLLRLHAVGLEAFEPANQDGRLCQCLAVLDQLVRLGALHRHGSSAARLESEMISWLERHQHDVTSMHCVRGDAAKINLLRDAHSR